MPVRELKIIQAKVNIVRMQMAKLIRGVEIKSESVFPRMDVEEYDGGPEEIAALVRKAWGLQPGPIPHMVNAIEDVGGVVFRWPFGNRKLDAISQCVPGLPPLFFVNAQASNDRVRFSLAHELGHVVMHRVPTPDQEPVPASPVGPKGRSNEAALEGVDGCDNQAGLRPGENQRQLLPQIIHPTRQAELQDDRAGRVVRRRTDDSERHYWRSPKRPSLQHDGVGECAFATRERILGTVHARKEDIQNRRLMCGASPLAERLLGERHEFRPRPR
jgi:hypothetical protein